MYIRVPEGSGRARTPIAPLEFLGHPLGLGQTPPDPFPDLTRLASQQSAGMDPNSVERQRILTETKCKVEPNPYYGLTDRHLEATLLASRSGVMAIPMYQPPEVLLALWTKEGSHYMQGGALRVPSDPDFARWMNGGRVTTGANAKVLVRSFIFWTDLGADRFVYFRAGAEDNLPILNDATVADHEMRFSSVVQNLTMQGFLTRNIASTVTSELSVTTPSPGIFSVTPSVAFYSGALALMGGLFSCFQRGSFRLLGSGPGSPMSLGLSYMHWNLGSAKFGKFLKDAEGLRRKAGSANIEQWALHTRPLKGQWDQPRHSAIKFEFLVGAYAKLFLPPPPFPIPTAR